MQGDTIEGAELGIAVAGTIAAMLAANKLESRKLPLTRAILTALTQDATLDIPWQDFHRHA